MKSLEHCEDCPLKKVFNAKNPLRFVRRILLGEKERLFDCNFVPIQEETSDQVIAAAVYMHDLGDRQLLWEVLEVLEGIEDIEEMEKLILKTFKEFGFARAFRFSSFCHSQAAARTISSTFSWGQNSTVSKAFRARRYSSSISFSIISLFNVNVLVSDLQFPR